MVRERSGYRIREPFWVWVPAGLLVAATLAVGLESAIFLFFSNTGFGTAYWSLSFYGSPVLLIVAFIFIVFLNTQRKRNFTLFYFCSVTALLICWALVITPLACWVISFWLDVSALLGTLCPPGVSRDDVTCQTLGHLIWVIMMNAIVVVFPLPYAIAIPAAIAFVLILPFLVLRRHPGSERELTSQP